MQLASLSNYTVSDLKRSATKQSGTWRLEASQYDAVGEAAAAEDRRTMADMAELVEKHGFSFCLKYIGV